MKNIEFIDESFAPKFGHKHLKKTYDQTFFLPTSYLKPYLVVVAVAATAPKTEDVGF